MIKELYVDPTTYKVRVKDESGKDMPLEKDKALIKKLVEQIKSNYLEAWVECLAASKQWPEEIRALKALERFCRCNFGMLDGTADITDKGCELEEVQCPLRGYCRHEFIICKPKLAITDLQMNVVEEMISGNTKEGIATKMKTSIANVKRWTYRLRKRFGIANNTGLVSFFRGAHQERRMEEYSFIKNKK